MQLHAVIHHKSVQIVLKRLDKYGISLQKYCGDIIGDPFGSNPYGFNFVCQNVNDFKSRLRANKGFAEVRRWIDMKKGSDCFREDSRPDSLHIIINNIPGGESTIHLDSVSIVERRGDKGEVVYTTKVPILLKHAGIDKFHFEDPGDILK